MISKTFTKDKHGREFFYIRTGEGSKLFYVKKYENKQAAEKAADEFIVQYTLFHPDEKRKHIRYRTLPTRRSTSGIAGVYRTEYANHGIPHNYWCANIPFTHSGSRNISKRFCVETYGEEKAELLAVAARKNWESLQE